MVKILNERLKLKLVDFNVNSIVKSMNDNYM